MNALRQWLLGIVAAALGVSLAQALTPEGTVKKVERLLGGLVLLLAVLRPLGTLLPAAWQEGLEAFSVLEETEAPQAGGEAVKTLIAQKAGAYIVDKGQSLGASCEAQVTVAVDESGWPVPWEVQVRGRWTGEQKTALGQAIQQDLNIPPQRQFFQEEGT